MEDKHNDRWLWFLIVILCVVAVGKVAMQDVPRIRLSALRQNDVNQLYLGSRVWLRGQNPYSIDALFLEMKRSNPVGAAGLNGLCTTDCHLYYPPSALPVIALFSWTPWKLFHAIYLATCILVYLFVLYRLSLLIEIPVHRCLFLSLGIAFGPYHSGLDTNNISALLIPLVLLSTLCLDSVWAFALTGVIASLKPPLVLVLLLYYLLRKDRRVLTVSAPIILVISAISLIRLRSITWWPTYMHSIRDYAAGGATLGVTNHGILNFGFSNLQALYYVLFHSAHYAAVGNYVTLILLGALFTWSVLRWPTHGMSSDSTTLAISIVGCLTLFQSSLQYYNYVFLLAAGVFALGHRTKGVRLGLMAALCSFVFPPSLLLSLSSHSREPIDAMVQLAHREPWKASQLTHGQELLACIPSIIFFLIALCLVVTFQIKRRRLAAPSWGSQPMLPALLGQKRIARISNLSN